MIKNQMLMISDEEYFTAPGINYSSMKNFAISPKHYKYYLDNPPATTAAQEFGSAVHCAILRPDLFEQLYFECDEKIDRRTKEGKAIVEAAGERKIVPSLIRTKIVPEVKKLVAFEPMLREVSVFWDDCKAKLDAYDPANGIIYDIKTTSENTPEGFCRAFLRFQYYLQAAHYKEAVRACKAPYTAYKVLTIESSAPYDVALYDVDPLYVRYGEQERLKLLEGIRKCDFEGEWKGIAKEGLIIPFPNFLNIESVDPKFFE